MAIELITAGTQVIATIKVTPAKENGVGSITNLSRRGQKALIRPPLLKWVPIRHKSREFWLFYV